MWMIDSRCTVSRGPVSRGPVRVAAASGGRDVVIADVRPVTGRRPAGAAALFLGTATTVHPARASVRGAGP